MNYCNQRTESPVVHDFPLFASSWVALFMLLRENLHKAGARGALANRSDRTGCADRRH
jgi:hypothetical protein